MKDNLLGWDVNAKSCFNIRIKNIYFYQDFNMFVCVKPLWFVLVSCIEYRSVMKLSTQLSLTS